MKTLSHGRIELENADIVIRHEFTAHEEHENLLIATPTDWVTMFKSFRGDGITELNKICHHAKLNDAIAYFNNYKY